MLPSYVCFLDEEYQRNALWNTVGFWHLKSPHDFWGWELANEPGTLQPGKRSLTWRACRAGPINRKIWVFHSIQTLPLSALDFYLAYLLVVWIIGQGLVPMPDESGSAFHVFLSLWCGPFVPSVRALFECNFLKSRLSFRPQPGPALKPCLVLIVFLVSWRFQFPLFLGVLGDFCRVLTSSFVFVPLGHLDDKVQLRSGLQPRRVHLRWTCGNQRR